MLTNSVGFDTPLSEWECKDEAFFLLCKPKEEFF